MYESVRNRGGTGPTSPSRAQTSPQHTGSPALPMQHDRRLEKACRVNASTRPAPPPDSSARTPCRQTRPSADHGMIRPQRPRPHHRCKPPTSARFAADSRPPLRPPLQPPDPPHQAHRSPRSCRLLVPQPASCYYIPPPMSWQLSRPYWHGPTTNHASTWVTNHASTWVTRARPQERGEVVK